MVEFFYLNYSFTGSLTLHFIENEKPYFKYPKPNICISNAYTCEDLRTMKEFTKILEFEE